MLRGGVGVFPIDPVCAPVLGDQRSKLICRWNAESLLAMKIACALKVVPVATDGFEAENAQVRDVTL